MSHLAQDFEEVKRQLWDDSFVKEVHTTRWAVTRFSLLMLSNFLDRTETYEFPMTNKVANI